MSDKAAPDKEGDTFRSTAEKEVRFDTGDAVLAGDLTVPTEASGVVVFAHGSGSSRHSPRNRAVANDLQGAGLATLLMDLLTADEEELDARTRPIVGESLGVVEGESELVQLLSVQQELLVRADLIVVDGIIDELGIGARLVHGDVTTLHFQTPPRRWGSG